MPPRSGGAGVREVLFVVVSGGDVFEYNLIFSRTDITNEGPRENQALQIFYTELGLVSLAC